MGCQVFAHLLYERGARLPAGPIAGHLPGVEAAHEVHGPAGALLALARALLRGGAVRLLLLLGDA